MNSRSSTRVLTALMLALAAGASATVSAQVVDNPTAQSGVAASTVDYRSSKWLNDRKVVNNNAEEIAEVSELILDRGSGRIEYVVIKTGATFGLGGRAVAIPYGSFRWEAGGKDRLMLAMTAEQLKAAPEYTPGSWKAMKETVRDDKDSLRQRLAADAVSASDPYSGNLDTARTERVEGEIIQVDRVRTSTFGEHVMITVKTADGALKRVALGPSWYINGASAAPMRGDRVVVSTLALPRDQDQLLAATELRTGDRDLRLRASDGSPAWSMHTIESNGHSYSTPYSRYLLLSHLPGMTVDCRGSECGKINDIILDRNSGEIGFVSIDPNQNFLGIGDTKRLVPWSVATVTLDGSMRIDASKEMVLASPETPGDLSKLNFGTHAEQVYKAYNVPAPRFDAPAKPFSAATPDMSGAWYSGGSIIGAIDPKSTKLFDGKVISVSEVTFGNGVQPAQALKVRIPGDPGPEEIILIGPASYMKNQSPTCQTKDLIKVEACRTTIDGRPYWIARSITCRNTRVELLDSNNVPAWAKP